MTTDRENPPAPKVPARFVETFDNFCVGLVDLKQMRGLLAELLEHEPELGESLLPCIDAAFREGLIKATTYEVLTTDIDRITSEDEPTEWSEQTLENFEDEPQKPLPAAEETNHPPPDDAESLPSQAEGNGEDFTSGALLNNRFELGARIGSGSMADVFEAIDRRKQEAGLPEPRIAVKVISKAFSRHANALETLQREALNGQGLLHPNIVRIFDCDRDGNRFFMTMELLEGEPLSALLDRRGFRPLPFDQALSIMRGSCAGLAHAHDQGIVHADIKPGNIFIPVEGPPKLLDFGIARITREDGERAEPPVIGAHTPAFASCEVLEGEEPTEQDDLFSLACVAYRMFAGRRPFGGSNAVDAERKGLVPQPIETLSTHQWAALANALTFRREQRPGSVADFTARFFSRPPETATETADDASTDVFTPAPAFPAAARQRQRVPLRYALPALAALLAVIVLMMQWQPDAEPVVPTAVFEPPATPRGVVRPIQRPEPVADEVADEVPVGPPPEFATGEAGAAPEAVTGETGPVQAAVPAPETATETTSRAKTESALPSPATELAAQADAAMQAGRLLDPEDDSAYRYVTELEALDPDSADTRSRKTRLADLMLIEALVAISDQDFSAADRWIAETKNLGVPESSLQRFESELQKARDADEARRKESLGAIFASATPAAILADSDVEFSSGSQSVTPARAPAQINEVPKSPGTGAGVGSSFALAMVPGALPMVETPSPAEPEPGSIGGSKESKDIPMSELEFKRFVEPKVPRGRDTRNASGWVELRFRVTSSGRTDDITVTSSEPDDRFDKSAITAVSKWRFKPLFIDGVPTEKYSMVRLRFEPQ